MEKKLKNIKVLREGDILIYSGPKEDLHELMRRYMTICENENIEPNKDLVEQWKKL